MSGNSGPFFDKLPGELRNAIYDFAFTTDATETEDKSSEAAEDRSARKLTWGSGRRCNANGKVKYGCNDRAGEGAVARPASASASTSSMSPRVPIQLASSLLRK